MRHYSRICVFSLLLVLAFSTLARAEPPVQINEIAWAGTRASWADEWIELKNVGEETVDLHGWSVRWGDVLIPFIEEDNTLEVRNLELEPGEYMLLERSDDETVPSVEADLIFTGSLSNSGEVIQLENSNG
ncbi:MAG: lamin tail domain-containing protein, partial [Candidatus Acetothermia bacterium]